MTRAHLRKSPQLVRGKPSDPLSPAPPPRHLRAAAGLHIPVNTSSPVTSLEELWNKLYAPIICAIARTFDVSCHTLKASQRSQNSPTAPPSSTLPEINFYQFKSKFWLNGCLTKLSPTPDMIRDCASGILMRSGLDGTDAPQVGTSWLQLYSFLTTPTQKAP